jgi:glycosyltransferase involved in cell wall biosynthesis
VDRGNFLTHKIGIVVPTLGKRPEYLDQCLESIKNASSGPNSAYVIVVAPKSFLAKKYIAADSIHKLVLDPGTGLSEAINVGMGSMPDSVEYLNWLGDDDLLTKNSLDIASASLDGDSSTVAVFGGCDYIDSNGAIVWTNKSGPWAVPLLRFGPDLIPQPGALFRRSSFELVGGLDSRYDWAFDLDLFIKLSKVGKLKHVNSTLSNFRWHPESLSVEYRQMSVNEASRVRLSHLPKPLKPFSVVWEFPVRLATMMAGNNVTSNSKKKAR